MKTARFLRFSSRLQCHQPTCALHSLNHSIPLLIRCSRRSFAHKDTLKKLKRQIGLGKKKNFGPKRGQKGRAPGWLEQSNLIGPRVAIVGRTNVGKSTLFNKLAGKPIAIADNTAGVTRDRKEAQGRLVDLEFIMVDCPGIEELPASELKTRKIDLNSKEQVMRGMIEQSQYAIQYADIILFLYDAKVGIQLEDKYIAQWLQRKLKLAEIEVSDSKPGSTVMQSQLQRNMPRSGVYGIKDRNSTRKDGGGGIDEVDKKYVIAVANKVETHMDAHDVIAQGYELNLGQTVTLSCHSGDGFVDLFHAMDDVFQQMDRWRDHSVSRAYFDKFGGEFPGDSDDGDHDTTLSGGDGFEGMEEELTYIPLSALHELQSEHDRKWKELPPPPLDDDDDADLEGVDEVDLVDAEREFMSSFDGGDAFEFKYDADELDALNIDDAAYYDEDEKDGFGELDYDQIAKEYKKMEREMKQKERLKTNDGDDDDESGYLEEWELSKYDKIAETMTGVDIGDAAILDDDLFSDLSMNGTDGMENVEEKEEDRLKQLFELKLCIVGRPNVGKSSLVNAMLGENRCLVADMPGITRDSVAIPMQHKESGMNFKLIDTAGLLGLNKTSYELQNEGSRLNILVLRECLRSIRFSNIIGIVIDINDKVLNTIDYLHLPKKLVFVNNELRRLKLKTAQKQREKVVTEREIADLNKDDHLEYDELIESNEMLSMDDESSKMDKLHFDAINAARTMINSIIDDFDRQLIEYCIAQGRGVVLVINKWDKITDKHKVILKLLKYSLPLVFRETGGIPICVTSAKYKKGINSLIENAISIYQKWNSRVPTPILNRFIYDMQQIYPPPSIKQIRKHGRWVRYIRPKVRYMTQYTIRPPSFIAFCGTQIITDYYFYKLRRFLRNEFGLNGVPIRIKMRSNMDINKYEDKYLDQLLQSKRKKKDKRRGRLRRLSLTEILKMRKFRKQVKEFENAKDPERNEREQEYGRRTAEIEENANVNAKGFGGKMNEIQEPGDERYKKYMNAMVERLEMSRQELKLKKQQNKKLTVDNFAKVERTKYRTYIPKQ